MFLIRSGNPPRWMRGEEAISEDGQGFFPKQRPVLSNCNSTNRASLQKLSGCPSSQGSIKPWGLM